MKIPLRVGSYTTMAIADTGVSSSSVLPDIAKEIRASANFHYVKHKVTIAGDTTLEITRMLTTMCKIGFDTFQLQSMIARSICYWEVCNVTMHIWIFKMP